MRKKQPNSKRITFRERLTAVVVGLGVLMQGLPVAAQNDASVPLAHTRTAEYSTSYVDASGTTIDVYSEDKVPLLSDVNVMEDHVLSTESGLRYAASAQKHQIQVPAVTVITAIPETIHGTSLAHEQEAETTTVVDTEDTESMETASYGQTRNVSPQDDDSRVIAAQQQYLASENSTAENAASESTFTGNNSGETITAASTVTKDTHTVTTMRQEYAPYEIVTKASPLLPEGARQLVREGEQGIIDVTAVQTVSGSGEVLSETVTGRSWSYLPRSEVTLVGANVPVSALDFGVPLDENGRPMGYSRVLKNQVATGYSARPGAKTASGMPTMVGHVAVDPSEIPYGSRLYIVSSDGSFVYGYAVAADTGVGLLQGIIDVDLFYETYQESALNGRKTVDIYVL